MSTFSDETLVQLVAQGCKVSCPVCDRRVMSQSYAKFSASGIGMHIRQAHPELEPEVFAASQRMEAKMKARKELEAREARERPNREYVVTGRLLDEISEQLSSLIDMMEPYYAQSNVADDAIALIAQIEAMHARAALTNSEGGGE